MILFDSHCHLDDKSYDHDLKAVMDRAENEKVHAVMIAGVDIDTALKAIRLADLYENIFTAVGIHPHEAKDCPKDKLNTLIKLAKNNDCVKAWGETGLDFNRMFSPIKEQETCLVNQLEIADSLKLPLILHERDSQGRLYDIVKSDAPEHCKAVVHCFSGTKKEMFRYLDLGYYIGITGIVTIEKRGQHLRSLVPHIPENRIVIETDAPYLTPAPQKNKTNRNEPAFVKSVMLRLAEIKNADADTLSQTIFDNTKALYNLEF